MKYLILAVALLVTKECVASEKEVSIGYTSFGKQPNGFWYQKGFPYKLDLYSPSFSASYYTGDDHSKFQYGVSYTYLGKAHTTAMAVPNDDNYDPVHHTCFTPCWDLSKFDTVSSSQGISFIVRKNISLSLFVESGVMWQWTTNDVKVYGWQSEYGGEKKDIEAHHKPKLIPLPQGSVGYRIDDNWIAKLSVYGVKSSEGEYPAVIRGASFNIALTYVF